MARRARLRTEKRLTALEATAKTFEPSEPMRLLSRQEVAVVWETLAAAMSPTEFREWLGPLVDTLSLVILEPDETLTDSSLLETIDALPTP